MLIEKLDVDHDNFVPLADIISLAEGEGLGIVIGEDETVASIASTTQTILKEAPSRFTIPTIPIVVKPVKVEEPKKESKKELKKEDVVSD